MAPDVHDDDAVVLPFPERPEPPPPDKLADLLRALGPVEQRAEYVVVSMGYVATFADGTSEVIGSWADVPRAVLEHYTAKRAVAVHDRVGNLVGASRPDADGRWGWWVRATGYRHHRNVSGLRRRPRGGSG